MPVPKRYFKVSQEINHDPEMWTLTEKYGERALRTWLEILVYLDKTQNRWRMVDGWLASLSRAVRQTPASVSRTVGQLLANGWLEVFETTANGSPSVVGASNWMKYNRTQEQKGNGKNKTTLPSFPTPTPTPTPTPSLALPKKKNKPLRADFMADGEWIEELKKNPAYLHVNFAIEMGKMDAWFGIPKNAKRKRTKTFVLNWINKIEPPIHLVSSRPTKVVL